MNIQFAQGIELLVTFAIFFLLNWPFLKDLNAIFFLSQMPICNSNTWTFKRNGEILMDIKIPCNGTNLLSNGVG